MDDIRYEILQLKDEYADRRFTRLSELDQAAMPIRDEQYQHVYQDTCRAGTALDEIFVKFNMNRPSDFKGWSLSVGDVILMHSPDGDHAYFVDSVGFPEIPGFLEPLEMQQEAQEPEAMQVTLRSATREEQDYAYALGDADGTAAGIIGHLRADMGYEGESFFAKWMVDGEVPEGFNVYLNTIISELRSNPAFEGIMSSRKTLGEFCGRHPESRIPEKDSNSYAFRVDAGEYSTILRLTPTRGEYNVYAYCYQRDALDKVLDQQRLEQAKAFAPVYRHTAAFARGAGELEAWRASHRENVACREAIDAAIRQHFDGSHLDGMAVSMVMKDFGAERVAYVLANTVTMKEHDGRFSRDNRAWAQAENIPIDRTEFGFVHNDEYVSRSHPAVLDGYISAARREMEMRTVEKSITVQLNGDSRQRQAQRENRDSQRRDGQPAKRSVRTKLREKQAQTHAKASEKKQPVRAPKRETI